MPKMIQIRDMPDHLHRTLKLRAVREGMSLSDYLKRELHGIAERPTMREWLDLVAHDKPIPKKKTSAQIIRELRDSR